MQTGLSRLASGVMLAASLCVLPHPGHADDSIAGLYIVKGTSQGGRAYEGVAQISAAGKTYEILWQIGKDTYRGRGLSYGKGLAFAFVGAGFTKANIVLYEQAGAGIWCGIWTSDNPDQLGQEALILKRDSAAAPDVDCREITALRDGVDVLDRQVAWDQGDGNPQLADKLGGERGNQGSRPLGAGGRTQHQDGDRGLLVD
jgi:hypothetical protein